MYKPYIGTEQNFQQAVARYLDSLGVLWFHPANERKTTPQAGARLKRAGVKAGCPDCLIFDNTYRYRGLAIELKVGKNGPSEYQETWLQNLSERGWQTLVSYSLDEVMEVVTQYLKR